MNPILLWELILKQQYEKVFGIDSETALYNIEIRKEYSLTHKILVKIVHLFSKNLLLVFVDLEGHDLVIKLMKKLFKFQLIRPPASANN